MINLEIEDVLSYDLGHEWETSSINNYVFNDYSVCKKCLSVIYINGLYFYLKFNNVHEQYVAYSAKHLLFLVSNKMLSCDEVIIKAILE